MRSIEAEFKIVTPMFISGAKQEDAELRVPSIKGMLRFWWRAINYNKDNKELLENESKIFGSSRQNIGQSKVLIQLLSQKVESKQIESKWKANDWRSYVGYGLSEELGKKEKKSDKKEKEGKYRRYLDAGGKFRIKCISKSSLEFNEFVDAIKLFGLLGGLGSRSRKGWGSVAITDLKVDSVGGNQAWKIPQTREEYVKELKSNIGKIQLNEQPVYSALSKMMAIRVGNSCKSYEDAFRDIATKYREHIKGLKEKKHREDFGLPRKGISEERRASPVMLHIHQAGNEFFWVCIFLNSKFLPSGNDSNKYRDAVDNYEAVKDFMDKIGGEKVW